MEPVITKDIAKRCVLFGACHVPKVGTPVSKLSSNDLAWAAQMFTPEELAAIGVPLWTLSGDGYGNGYGYGNGDGDGNGYGYGDGYGNGYGYGYGYGDGNGYGYGDGDGDGNGNGYGNGYGYGYGYGYGNGSRDLGAELNEIDKAA